tara:strand:+ start:395 stop:754 length:360 start_codon:yes stop_codon:yes gene_type:complete
MWKSSPNKIAMLGMFLQQKNQGDNMRTILIQYQSGQRQVITDSADSLLDFLLMEIDNIISAEDIQHINNTNDVKAIRHRLGLTQKQLAEKIGVSSTTIIRWEKNVHGVSKDNLKKLQSL